MSQKTAQVWAIFDPDDTVRFLGDVGDTEADAWDEVFNDPPPSYVEQLKAFGIYARLATLTWEK